MKSSIRMASSGKVTLCFTCEGSGELDRRLGSCHHCGGIGLLFDGKDFSTCLTTTTVIPNKAGDALIRPNDDIHQRALLEYHYKVLKDKIELIDKYRKTAYILNAVRIELERANVTLSEEDLYV